VAKPVGSFSGATGVVLSWESAGGTDGDPFASTTTEVGSISVSVASAGGEVYTDSVPAEDVIGLGFGASEGDLAWTQSWGSGETTLLLRTRADFVGSPADEFPGAGLQIFANDFSGFMRFLYWTGSDYAIQANGNSQQSLGSAFHDGFFHDMVAVFDWSSSDVDVYIDGVFAGNIDMPVGSASGWIAFINSGTTDRTQSVFRSYDYALTATEVAALFDPIGRWVDVGASAGSQSIDIDPIPSDSFVGDVGLANQPAQSIGADPIPSDSFVGDIGLANQPAQSIGADPIPSDSFVGDVALANQPAQAFAADPIPSDSFIGDVGLSQTPTQSLAADPIPSDGFVGDVGLAQGTAQSIEADPIPSDGFVGNVGLSVVLVQGTLRLESGRASGLALGRGAARAIELAKGRIVQ
jgi:hypothetical protein